MDDQPPKKSKKVLWILGGVALLIVGVVSSGSSNTQAPTGAVSPSSQTANIAQQVVQPVTPPAAPIAQQNELSNSNYYINSDGNSIHSPAYLNSGVPAGATAQCIDGTYSFSQHRSGTCSHHGGVATWF